MFANKGIAGGQVQTFDQSSGPGSGFPFQAEQSRVGLRLFHSGQDDKLITAGSEAFAAGENLRNAAGGTGDQLISRLVADGIIDGFQPVDVNGKRGQITRDLSGIRVTLQGFHVCMAAEHTGEGIRHELGVLPVDMFIRVHLVEFRVMDKHQRNTHCQRDIRGPVLTAQQLLDADADDHEKQNGIERSAVLPAIGLSVRQKLSGHQDDYQKIDKDINRIERAVGIMVLIVNHNHPAIEAGHNLEKCVGGKHGDQGFVPPVAKLHLRREGAPRQRRENIVGTFHPGQDPFRNAFLAV